MTAQLTVFHALMTVRIYQKLNAHLAVMATEDNGKVVMSLIDDKTFLKLTDARFKGPLTMTSNCSNPAFLYWLAQQSCVQDYLSSVFYLVKEKRLVNISRSDLNSIAKQSADSSRKLEQSFKNIEFKTGILIEDVMTGLVGADLVKIREEPIEQISFYVLATSQRTKWFSLSKSDRYLGVIGSISTASGRYLFSAILPKSTLEELIKKYKETHPEILVFQKTKEDEVFERCFEGEKFIAQKHLKEKFRDIDKEIMIFPASNPEVIRVAKKTPQA